MKTLERPQALPVQGQNGSQSVLLPRQRIAGAIVIGVTPIDFEEFLPGALGEEVRSSAVRTVHFDPGSGDEQGFARLLAEVDPEILVSGWKTPRLPEKLPPGLRYVCNLTGSVRHLVDRAHIERGLQVTNWGGSIARVVAEGALFHALASLRRATHWALAMHREGAWKTRDARTASLFGRRVGIHGFGNVARELVRLLEPFQTEISVFAPDVDAAAELRYGVRAAASLEELFADNDVIFELAPLNADTEGIVTERLLRLIPEGGVFVNTGRGKVVDEAALVRVAQEGRVLFGIDVFAVEPLPASHPLRGLPNVTLTPHLGGPTTDRRRDAGAHALRNLRAYLTGQPLTGLVTPEVYDLSS